MFVSHPHRFFVFLSICFLCACVHNNKSVEVVPYVSGTISIQTWDKQELALKDDAVYLVPATPQSKAFFEAHADDYYVDGKLLMELPKAVSTRIDRENAFTFSNLTAGSYYVYWQLPREQGRNPLNRSDPNLLSLFTLTAEHK